MSTTLTVPSIKCEGCANTISKEIKGQDDAATVNIDVDTKIVEVDSGLSEEAIRQAISAAGHTVAD